ncbi:MAG: hypothetical protein HKN91_00880 [Acidimicrobiia bacterium]|nr:hypothetical protein [Acidimicrobiia bacterium]
MVIFLKIVHVTVAAVWLGHKVLVPFDLRTVAAAGPESGDAVAKVEMASRIGQTSGLLTFFSGLALIYAVGGFGAVPSGIYVGAGIVIVMFVVGATVARPAWLGVKRSFDVGDTVGARQAAGRLNTALLVEGVLWVVALGTMIS